MEKALKLYNSQGAFPSAEKQIEILGFNYDAKRMGGAPIISATVMFPSCLDKEWKDDVFVEFNGERYFLKQTPTSSKSNTEALYKHECEFVSERIALDNVYFIDAVVGNPQGNEKPISNSATFSFFGTIYEFAKRLNAAFEYCGLDYRVRTSNLVDENGASIDKTEKMLSFDKVTFSNALQETYNQFEIPYYYEGKEIVFDYFQHQIKDVVFKYGHNNELLSITKTNANQKLVNRCTGTGSTENIPYYYPNVHPQGELKPIYKRGDNILDGGVSIEDDALFAKNVLQTDELSYGFYLKTTIDGYNDEFYEIKEYVNYKNSVPDKALINNSIITDKNWFLAPTTAWGDIEKLGDYSLAALGTYNVFDNNNEPISFDSQNNAIAIRVSVDEKYFISPNDSENEKGYKTFVFELSQLPYFGSVITGELQKTWEISAYVRANDNTLINFRQLRKTNGFEYSYRIDNLLKRQMTILGTFQISSDFFGAGNDYDKAIYITLSYVYGDNRVFTFTPQLSVKFANPKEIFTWTNSRGNRYIELSDLGLASNEQYSNEDKIVFEQVSYVQPMQTLMPPIYWNSEGDERYYNAKQYPFKKTYEIEHVYKNGDVWHNELGEYEIDGYIHNEAYKDENGNYYIFANLYNDNKRKEHIVEFPDIKPSIENVYDANGNPVNSFIEFAYDEDDNDEMDDSGNYLHPYFYGKLRKLTFNLFTHASEKGEATFSMTSGKCGACNFVLGVNSESLKNTVQVNKDGTLKRYDSGANKGRVIWDTPQDEQNDTVNNEVWVALKKDTNTYGVIMPNEKNNYRPEGGDTFVLTNIKFPTEYIRAAEERLKEEIIKFMYENNMEKFTFSIRFSRIYLEENPQILAKLNENSLITVEYNGEEKTLYVSSFAYKKDANTALPEITIELAETLSASQNALQTAISQVKTDVLDRVQKMDIAAMVAAKFISKDVEDYAKQKITFNRGIALGSKNDTNGKIDELGNSELSTLVLRQYITSPQFVNGFAGSGYRMWLDELGLSHLTIDNLTVRQKMTIFELLISKARAVNGGLWVSAANGKIAMVVDRGDDYEITLEDDNLFVDGDYIRCQVFSLGEQRFYWAEISRVDGGRLYVDKSEFGNSAPIVGDEIVLDGSRNANRQNAIHISASEDGQPRIAIYNGIKPIEVNGVKSISHEGCLRTQLGDLNNIQDDILKPQGDGLYSDNAYLKGEFILKNSGKSVDTMFAITEESIKASVEQTQAEAIKGKTLLYNASFTKGLDGWLTSNTDSTYFSGTSLLFASGSMLAQSVTVSNELVYDNVFFVNINNGWIKQSNMYFVNKPEFDAEKRYPLHFSCNLRCHTAGKLTVKVGEVVLFEQEIQPSEEFVQIDVDKITLNDVVENLTWNGSGDFYLEFSGIADIFGLTIYTEKTEVTHKTFFDMSDRLINFGAQQLDENGSIREESGIMVKPDGAEMYAYNGKTGKYASIGVADGNKVKLTGDKIILEGDVTANGSVNIDKNGNVTIKGRLDAGSVGDFTINKSIISKTAYGEMALHSSGLNFVESEGSFKLNVPINIDLPNKHTTTETIFVNIPKEQNAINIYSGSINIGNGHIKAKNSIFHCVQFKNITEATDDFDYHYLDPNIGTSWMVYNTVGGLQAAYLPRLEDMRSLLGISDAETPFGITIEIVNSRNSTHSIAVGFENEAHNVYDWNGNQEEGNYRSLQKGNSLRVMLIFDGEEYYAQIINFEN